MRDFSIIIDQLDPDFAPGRIGELCGFDHDDSGIERIFFIDASGQKCLKPRQACAVESAALTNLDMTVYVFMSLKAPPGKPDVPQSDERNCRTMGLIRILPNVQIIYEENLLAKYLNGTPLEPLYSRNMLNQSIYNQPHASGALRIAMLNEGGGIYLDFDIVVLRSLRCLKNSIGMAYLNESLLFVESSVLAFSPNHTFLQNFMKHMVGSYVRDQRDSLGYKPLTDFFRDSCNCTVRNCSLNGNCSITTDCLVATKKYDGTAKNLDFFCFNGSTTPLTLMSSLAFNPIKWYFQQRFYDTHKEPVFLSTFENELKRMRAHSYLAHIHGSSRGAFVQKESLYAFLARRFCPAIY